jgi:hypothetical protein
MAHPVVRTLVNLGYHLFQFLIRRVDVIRLFLSALVKTFQFLKLVKRMNSRRYSGI